MNSLSVLDQISEAQAKAKQTADKQFRSLVLAVADEKEIAADVINARLQQTGRSLADLRSAVETLLERRLWAKDFAMLQPTIIEGKSILADREQLERDFVEFRRQQGEKFGVLEVRERENERRQQIALQAEDKLRQSCDVGIIDKIATLRSQIGEQMRIVALHSRTLAADAATAADERVTPIDGGTAKASYEQSKALVDEAERRIRECERQIQELEPLMVAV